MSNNRKKKSTASPVTKVKKAKLQIANVNGIYPQMYIGSSGICCELVINKPDFLKFLLEAPTSERGFLVLSLFPKKEMLNKYTHFCRLKSPEDWQNEDEVVEKMIKDYGLDK
jgi:hypothetical protein